MPSSTHRNYREIRRESVPPPERVRLLRLPVDSSLDLHAVVNYLESRIEGGLRTGMFVVGGSEEGIGSRGV